MIRSPFPGMDPYLEMHWRDVHTALMVYARDAIQDQLPGDLLARVEEGVSIDLGDELRGASPDVAIIERPESDLRAEPFGDAGTAVADPLVVTLTEPFTERHIVIVDPASGQRVVTVVEFLSRSNKTPGDGRELYRRKQQDYLAGGVNLVEIDLIRSGYFTLAVPPEKIDSRWRTPYQVCVRRATQPGEAEIYKAPLRERLPIIRIPLRPTDPDVLLDLQALIDECYRRGRYATIDYSVDPDPSLSPPDARWADEVLRAAGRRSAV